MDLNLATTLYDPLIKILRNWLQDTSVIPVEFTSLLSIRIMTKDEGISTYDAVYRIVSNAFQILESRNESAEKLLRLRFLNNNTPSALSREMHISVETFYRRQREAVLDLAKIIAQQEQVTLNAYAAKRELQLPAPPYDRLFGTDAVQKELLSLLLSSDCASIVAILGLGGIGKTSVAYAISKQLLRYPHYEHIVWIHHDPLTLSGRTLSKEATLLNIMLKLAALPHIAAQKLTSMERDNRIRFVLKEHSHLVIIDNIEEKEVIAHLYEKLPTLANPSRFLITSRVQVPSNLPVYSYQLPELSQVHSFELLRYVGQQSNLRSIANADESLLQPIYKAVGGNPLALRLAVGMLLSYPYDIVIQSLSNGKLKQTKYLYERIYRNLWKRLTTIQKHILQTMLLNPNGVSGGQLCDMAGITDESAFWEAADDLIARSLLQVSGSIQSRNYQLHQLTATYIRSFILGQSPNISESL